jgi:hypothetical protein
MYMHSQCEFHITPLLAGLQDDCKKEVSDAVQDSSTSIHAAIVAAFLLTVHGAASSVLSARQSCSSNHICSYVFHAACCTGLSTTAGTAAAAAAATAAVALPAFASEAVQGRDEGVSLQDLQDVSDRSELLSHMQRMAPRHSLMLHAKPFDGLCENVCSGESMHAQGSQCNMHF